jgi:hypothetical protein
MAQDEARCVMLEEERPSCRIQTAGGLKSLPRQCRNFPRSVVRTPAGVEVAFLLDCPTVAGLVVDGPARFEWARAKSSEWSYPAAPSLSEEYLWKAGRSMPFSEVEDVREGWWSALFPEGPNGRDGEWLVRTLERMIDSPGEPSSAADRPSNGLSQTLDYGEAAIALSFLSRLPARGECYRTHRDALFSELTVRRDRSALEASAEEHVEIFACAASLILQHASVHDGMPAADGIRAAAQQILLALSLAQALRRGAGSSTRDALQDALSSSSHIFRYQRYSNMVFVD